MAELKVERYFLNDKCTIGRLMLDGKHIAYTLEDTVRTKKIKGKTAIPEGKYKVELHPTSRFSSDYELVPAGIKRIRSGGNAKPHPMLWVKNVPNFEYILIHWGNYPEDTEGCLLVGLSAEPKQNKVASSRLCYEKIYPILLPFAQAGNLTIEYINIG